MRDFYILRRLLLFFLLTVSWGMRGQEKIIFDFNDLKTISGSQNSVNYEASKDKGTTPPVVNTSSKELRIYQKNQLDIFSSEQILSIRITTSSSGYTPFLTCYKGTNKSDLQQIGTTELSPIGLIYTFENLNSEYFRLINTNKGTSKQLRIKTIEVIIQKDDRSVLSLIYSDNTPVIDITTGSPFINPLIIKIGEVVQNNIPVFYSSSKADVASVNSETGEITAHKHGETTITATVEETETYQSATASYKLTVTAPKPEMFFESTSVTKDILESPFRNRLTVTFDQNESLPVVYSSSDDKVAKIDESGTVTFLKAGSVTITATVEETETYQGATASYKLTVTTPKPEMVFEATSVQMDIRENSFHNPLTVKLYNQVNTELPVVYSSSNTGIATVGADGTVSFIKFGTVKITATINPTDLYQKASVSYDLNITAPTPVLTFEQPAIRVIGISETVTNPLSVMLEENPFTEGVVTYKSSNMSVATVDTNTGVVTPKGVGNVTITARMAEGTYYHASETTYQLFVDKSPSSLPFVFDGKSADITNMMGLTAESLGSDYAASPCLKFSSNTSSVLLSFDEVPGKLYFKVKQYSTLRGYFVVEQSADGQEFEVVAEYTSISETGETKLIENLKNSSRYIRWRFINRTGGNIALGGIELKKFSILKNPVFETEEETFFYSHEVRLSCATAEAKIYYTLTGEDPDSNSLLYTGPFTIEETTQIKAAAFLNDEKSDIISKTYTRLITSVKADKEGLVFPVLNLWEVPEKKSLSFTLKTEHLQSDLSVQVEGDGFSVDKSVLSKADANGAEINVTYLPLRHGTYSGSVIIKGDGLDEPTVVTLLGETKIVADELLLDEDFEFMKDLSDNNSFKIEGWTFASCYVDRANQRMRVGSSGSLGSVTLPQFDFSKEEYTYTLSFDSQIFNIADHKEMKVTIHGRDEIIKLSDGNKNYRFDIPVATGSTGSIRISGVQIINNRFYLDNIRIIKKLKKLAYTVPATTSYEDLNARLRLDGLTSVTFNQPVSFIDQGSIIAPANPNCLFYTPTDLGFGQNQVLEGNCANLSLSDNHPFDIVRPFSATAASYVRKAYQDGLWETIVLPYDVAESAMPQEYEFAKYDGLTADKSGVVFTEVKSLTAHTPYLMRYSGSNKTNGTALCHFEAVDVTIGEQIESAGFVGVYARTATEGKWLLNVKNGVSVFQKGLPESAINPFRAYLDLVLTESAGMRIVHRPADATSLDAVTSIGEWQLRSGSQGELIVTTREAMTIRIVAIDGRVLRVVSVDAGENRISGLPAGICIVNGKKGVVR